MSAATTEFAALLEHVRADPNIVGLLLGGSRGKAAYVTEESDYDAYVILANGGLLDEYAERFPSVHGDPVEYILVSLQSFREHALPGSPTRWNAYTFAHVEPLVDKLDGEIGRLAHAKTLPAPDDARDFLGGYVNLYYRSKKNLLAGRALEGRLDAGEALSWFLDFLFAAHGRVRPFNKWLLWELQHHPLDEPWREGLPARIDAIAASGDLDTQRGIFRDTEALARALGLGDVVDSWGPDVEFLRA